MRATLDALERRLDLLCSTGRRCGDACVEKSKECEGEAPQQGRGARAQWQASDVEIDSNSEGVTGLSVVRMTEPIPWKSHGKATTVNSLHVATSAMATDVGGAAIAELRNRGLLPNDTSSQAEGYEMLYGIGATEGEAFTGYDRVDVPPEVARKLAIVTARQMEQTIAKLPDGALLCCSAWDEDGHGAKRQKLFERAGFTFTRFGTGVAMVQGGRIVRLTARNDSRTDAAGGSLVQLIHGLLLLGVGPMQTPSETRDDD